MAHQALSDSNNAYGFYQASDGRYYRTSGTPHTPTHYRASDGILYPIPIQQPVFLPTVEPRQTPNSSTFPLPWAASNAVPLSPVASYQTTISQKLRVAEFCGWQIGAEKFLIGDERFLSDQEPLVRPQKTERRHLGTGTYGRVEEVTINGSAKMAQKTFALSRWASQREREIEMIKKEIEVMKRLAHPHIVDMIGAYQESENLRKCFIFTLMYPVGQNDLATFLHECKDAVPTHKMHYKEWIKSWFLCLAKALAYMHSQNIHHKDIKPLNIIHLQNRVLFTDFGSSREFTEDDNTQTDNPARASKTYAAPEVLGGVDGVPLRHGSRADVFSLGAVFVEMLTVLADMDIEDLREHVFVEGQPKWYSHSTHRLPSWFFNTAYRTFFYSLLQPMLQLDQLHRPRPQEVVNILMTSELGLICKPCGFECT